MAEGPHKITLERKGEMIPTSIKGAGGSPELEFSTATAPTFNLRWLTEYLGLSQLVSGMDTLATFAWPLHCSDSRDFGSYIFESF